MRLLPILTVLATLSSSAAAQCLIDELDISGLPANAEFGTSIAMDGDSMFVGTPGDTTNGVSTGAVYWYRRTSPTTWTLEDRFPGTTAAGRAVAVDGQWAAYSTGGGIQLLRRSGPQTWSYVDFIPAQTPFFGFTLDIADGPTPRLVIGSPTPIFHQLPEVWRFTGSAWVREQILQPQDGQDSYFGFDVAIDGSHVFIGSPFDPDAGAGVGSVYVYTRSGVTWSQTQELLPTWSGADNFGIDVDASDGTLIVASPGSSPERISIWERTGNTFAVDVLPAVLDSDGGRTVAIDGDRVVFNETDSDLRLLERDPSTGSWGYVGTAFGASEFGRAIDVDGGRIAVGRPSGFGDAYFLSFPLSDCDVNGRDDLCDIAGGSLGDNDNDGIPDTCDCEVYEFCEATPNSTGGNARIGGSGTPSLSGNQFSIVADNLPPGVPGLYFFGTSEVQVPFGDGFRCAGGPVKRLQPPVPTDGSGRSSRALDFAGGPQNFQTGDTIKIQLWYRDPMGPGGSGFNLTAGLSVTFCD